MSKSNMSDGQADAFAAVGLICVVLVWVTLWLNGMPA